MGLAQKALGLVKRFGAAVRFGAKVALNVLMPGSGVAVDLVNQVLECVHETAKDNYNFDPSRLPAATPQDLARVEQILDVLAGDLQLILAQVSALEAFPAAAKRIVEVAAATDRSCQIAITKLDELSHRFSRQEQKIGKVLDGQEEILDILRLQGKNLGAGAGLNNSANQLAVVQATALLRDIERDQKRLTAKRVQLLARSGCKATEEARQLHMTREKTREYHCNEWQRIVIDKKGTKEIREYVYPIINGEEHQHEICCYEWIDGVGKRVRTKERFFYCEGRGCDRDAGWCGCDSDAGCKALDDWNRVENQLLAQMNNAAIQADSLIQDLQELEQADSELAEVGKKIAFLRRLAV